MQFSQSREHLRLLSLACLDVMFICMLFGLSSCKKETSLQVFPVNESTCDLDEFKGWLEDLSNADIYLSDHSSAEFDDVFSFEEGSTLSICNGFISDISFNDLVWEACITFNDASKKIIPYIGEVDIEVLVNPSGYNPLSAILKFETPRSSKVNITLKSTESPDDDLIIPVETEGMQFEIPVLGLYHNSSNNIEIQLINGRDEIYYENIVQANTVNFFGGNIPIQIDKIDRARMADGRFHFVSALTYTNPNVCYMFDDFGHVRWILDYSGHPELNKLLYEVGVEQLANGNLYFGDITTNRIYEVDLFGNIINDWSITGYDFHHNVQEKPDGNFLVSVNKPGITHLNGKPSIEDFIIEIDRNSGAIVHEWDFRNLLDENRIALGNWPADPVVDWIHINAVIYDPNDNTIIASGRHQGLIKVGYDDKVKWIIGPHEAWGTNRNGEDCNQFLLTPLNQNGVAYDSDVALGYENANDFEWNWFQHAPLVKPDGNVMMFDNGYIRNFTELGTYSRAVEYKVDPQNMTVQQIWEYGKEREAECYSYIASDVDYYEENNSVVMASGSAVFNGFTNIGGRIVELDYTTKEVLFDAVIIVPGVTFHRVERMDLYPN